MRDCGAGLCSQGQLRVGVGKNASWGGYGGVELDALGIFHSLAPVADGWLAEHMPLPRPGRWVWSLWLESPGNGQSEAAVP